MRGAGHTSCPCCRASYAEPLLLPSVEEDPHTWFSVVDFDGNGQLSRREVIEVFKATLPIDHRSMEEAFPVLFAQWDFDGNGTVGFDEMMGPNGLFFYVRDAFRASNLVQIEPPDIHVDKQAWFHYWDEDCSGSLEKEEIVRSLVKTFRLSASPAQVNILRNVVDALWLDFDFDGSTTVSINEFCLPGVGLADTVIANLGV